MPNDNPHTFPVIVKAARSCASIYLNSRSIYFTTEDRDIAIEALDRKLQPGRERYSEKNQSPTYPRATIDKLPNDIIVQQFVPSIDYSIIVIEFRDIPIALNPTVYQYPPEDTSNPNRFLTFDIKFSPTLKEHLVSRSDNPVVFNQLKKLAVEAYQVNDILGGF